MKQIRETFGVDKKKKELIEVCYKELHRLIEKAESLGLLDVELGPCLDGVDKYTIRGNNNDCDKEKGDEIRDLLCENFWSYYIPGDLIGGFRFKLNKEYGIVFTDYVPLGWTEICFSDYEDNLEIQYLIEINDTYSTKSLLERIDKELDEKMLLKK